jgi:hypothetical protein
MWLDYWSPHDASKARLSGTTAKTALSLGSYSVFVRQGALIPILRQKSEEVGVM